MKVLVCTDFSAAAARGEAEAARRFADATLILFHAVDLDLLARVVEQTGLDGAHLRQIATSYADQRLAEILKGLRRQGRRAVPELVEGRPVDAALAAAARHRVELIVMGARARVAVGRFRIELVRRATVPVLVFPAPEA